MAQHFATLAVTFTRHTTRKLFLLLFLLNILNIDHVFFTAQVGSIEFKQSDPIDPLAQVLGGVWIYASVQILCQQFFRNDPMIPLVEGIVQEGQSMLLHFVF